MLGFPPKGHSVTRFHVFLAVCLKVEDMTIKWYCWWMLWNRVNKSVLVIADGALAETHPSEFSGLCAIFLPASWCGASGRDIYCMTATISPTEGACLSGAHYHFSLWRVVILIWCKSVCAPWQNTASIVSGVSQGCHTLWCRKPKSHYL